METVSIVAASLNLDNETYVDTSTEGGQLGREDRPSHPNLWDQTW